MKKGTRGQQIIQSKLLRNRETKIHANKVPRKELEQAYVELSKQFSNLKLRMKELAESRDEVRQQWRTRYNKLHYQVFKRDQKIYALREKNKSNQLHKFNAKKAAKKEYFKRIKGRKYKNVKSICDTLLAMTYLKSKTDMGYQKIAFLLWASTYESFSKTEYELDFGRYASNYYQRTNEMVKDEMLDVSPLKEGAKQIFFITQKGIKQAEAIQKFIKNSNLVG